MPLLAQPARLAFRLASLLHENARRVGRQAHRARERLDAHRVQHGGADDAAAFLEPARHRAAVDRHAEVGELFFLTVEREPAVELVLRDVCVERRGTDRAREDRRRRHRGDERHLGAVGVLDGAVGRLLGDEPGHRASTVLHRRADVSADDLRLAAPDQRLHLRVRQHDLLDGQARLVELAAAARLQLRARRRRTQRRGRLDHACSLRSGLDLLLQLIERGHRPLELELRRVDALGLRLEDAVTQQLVLLLEDRVRPAQLLELPQCECLLLLERLPLLALVACAISPRSEQRFERPALAFERPVALEQLVVQEHDPNMRARVRAHASGVSVVTGSTVRSVSRRPVEAEPGEEVFEVALGEHDRRRRAVEGERHLERARVEPLVEDAQPRAVEGEDLHRAAAPPVKDEGRAAALPPSDALGDDVAAQPVETPAQVDRLDADVDVEPARDPGRPRSSRTTIAVASVARSTPARTRTRAPLSAISIASLRSGPAGASATTTRTSCASRRRSSDAHHRSVLPAKPRPAANASADCRLCRHAATRFAHVCARRRAHDRPHRRSRHHGHHAADTPMGPGSPVISVEAGANFAGRDILAVAASTTVNSRCWSGR